MYSNILRGLALVATLTSLIGASTFNSWHGDIDKLVGYHDSGAYYEDLSGVIKEATFYLEFRLTQNIRTHNPRKLAIVMDIDETALSNFVKLKQLNFDVTEEKLSQLETAGDDPAIPYTLAFYNYAKEHHVAIFFITGRHQSFAATTQMNLRKVGYQQWDNILFNPDHTVGTDTVSYRVHARQLIQQAGYDIVMNIGNRDETLSGGISDMTFKLPNPFYQFHY